jgi:hypothetical protein
MPDGGRITIETANAHLDDGYSRMHAEVTLGHYVILAVSDTGTGMPPDVIARAFEPFFTTKPLGKGKGLGLSQIFGYVKQERGHVKIYSEVGHGTTVKVYLPRHMGSPEAPSEPALIGSSLGGTPSEVVLVVEDDGQLRQVAAANLGELGYTVVTSATAGRR